MAQSKSILATFFFLLLFAAKISVLHIYSHDCADKDSIENCAVCDWAIEQQQIVAVTEEFVTPNFDTLITDCDTHIFVTTNPFILEVPRSGLFSRPPPTLG